MGGGGSSNREAKPIPTPMPNKSIPDLFIDYNPNYIEIPNKINIAILILIIFILLFHLYIKSRIKY